MYPHFIMDCPISAEPELHQAGANMAAKVPSIIAVSRHYAAFQVPKKYPGQERPVNLARGLTLADTALLRRRICAQARRGLLPVTQEHVFHLLSALTSCSTIRSAPYNSL